MSIGVKMGMEWWHGQMGTDTKFFYLFKGNFVENNREGHGKMTFNNQDFYDVYSFIIRVNGWLI